MSDQSNGDVNVAVSSEEVPTTGGNVQDQNDARTNEVTGEPTETDAQPITRLRIIGNPLHASFTWRENDDDEAVNITRDWSDVPEDKAWQILQAAQVAGIRMQGDNVREDDNR